MKRQTETVSNQVLVFFNTGFNFVVCRKLISDHCPILYLASVPFFVKLGNSEIEQFEQCIFVWESTFLVTLRKLEFTLSTSFVVYITFLTALP